MTGDEELQEECRCLHLRVAELERAVQGLEREAKEHGAALVQERDAHAATQAELAALRRLEIMYQGLLDELPDVVFAKDHAWKLVIANKSFDEFFHISRGQLLGTTDYDFFPKELADDVRAFDAHVLAQGSPQEKLDQIPKGEDVRTYRSFKFPLRDAGGAIIGLGGIASDITDRARQEAEREALQQRLLEAQRAALRELSTPLIPLTHSAVLLPLIGTIDSQRAQQAMETLLDGIGRYEAKVAILDITGVRTIDTGVANGLLRAAQAAKLLGAEVVLTGIQPRIAQLLVELGIDLVGIVTRGTLPDGIAYALGR